MTPTTSVTRFYIVRYLAKQRLSDHKMGLAGGQAFLYKEAGQVVKGIPTHTSPKVLHHAVTHH